MCWTSVTSGRHGYFGRVGVVFGIASIKAFYIKALIQFQIMQLYTITNHSSA